MEMIGKILFWIAVFASLMAALYFAIKGQNYIYSFCYAAAAGSLLLARDKR